MGNAGLLSAKASDFAKGYFGQDGGQAASIANNAVNGAPEIEEKMRRIGVWSVGENETPETIGNAGIRLCQGHGGQVYLRQGCGAARRGAGSEHR